MTDEQQICCVCWSPGDWRGLHKHHIVHRSKRRCDARYNLLVLCARCHDAVHANTEPGWPALTLPMILGAKLESDPLHWEPDKLETLYCRRLPWPMPLPQAYLDERAKHRPVVFS